MSSVPKHIALIMDGNGRWATAKGLPRAAGHRQGAKTVTKVLELARDRGIKYVTMYAFSTENWNRPADEVDTLLNLFREFLDRDISDLQKQQVNVRFIGDRTRFPADIQNKMNKLEARTKDFSNYHVVLALSYSGRDELTRAFKRLATDVKDGRLKVESVTEDVLGSYLDTAGIPDPDLMVRTSGEQRTSGFLPWQLTYTEMYFTPVHWPDFDETELDKAIAAYAVRDRRFGKIKEDTDGKNNNK